MATSRIDHEISLALRNGNRGILPLNNLQDARPLSRVFVFLGYDPSADG
jgi:hypothetical protein